MAIVLKFGVPETALLAQIRPSVQLPLEEGGGYPIRDENWASGAEVCRGWRLGGSLTGCRNEDCYALDSTTRVMADLIRLAAERSC